MAKKNVIAVITARGGSKRIPMKNIKPLGGKPLISYIITAALRAKSVDQVMVSSDHPEIIKISKEYGAKVPFVRPPDLAEDVPSEWVVKHAVEYMEKAENFKADIVVMLQPTTPFCTGEDIDNCISKLMNNDFDAVLSAVKIAERPEWMYLINERDEAHPFLGKDPTGWAGVSQTLPKLYILNGGIYAVKKESLYKYESLLSGRISFHIMPREKSVDIDEPIDFVIAENILKILKESGDKNYD